MEKENERSTGQHGQGDGADKNQGQPAEEQPDEGSAIKIQDDRVFSFKNGMR